MITLRKTKIICTLGPSTDNPEIIEKMVKAGMNVARLNFSHGTHEEQLKRINMVKEVRQRLNCPLAILLDTKGPEIRIGMFKDGFAMLNAGQKFTLVCDEIQGDNQRVSVSHKKISSILKSGDTILIDDGLIELNVEEFDGKDVVCRVINGGKISNKKSINLPGVKLDMPYMTERDREDLLFGIKADVDYVAASFIRNADDVKCVRSLLDENGGKDIKLISKIENNEGVENIDEILAESNGIMIARGDMGVEISFERLPAIQKSLIKKCYEAGKPVITATQMLESMVHSPRPTRAEVSDVANAIYDGTSAIMLSGETAAGMYPIESVETMSKIAEMTEKNIHYKKRFLAQQKIKNTSITDAVSHAACTMAIDLGAAAIVAVTTSGHTARMLSKFRPSCPIIAVIVDEKAYHQTSMTWGVVPVKNDMQETMDDMFESGMRKAITTRILKKDDMIVLTGGLPVGIAGTTNVVKVQIL